MLQHVPLLREKLMDIQNICKHTFHFIVEKCLEMGSMFQDGASEYGVVEILRMYVVHTADKIEGIVKLRDLSKNES